MLILDYLQIIPAGKEAPEALREKIDVNLSDLRRLARELQSPVLVVSTLNRAAYGDLTKPPTLTAMKESGGIEYSADVVILLWRNEKESETLQRDIKDQKIDRIEAHIMKNRNAEVGSKIKLDFTPAFCKFDSAVDK